jgi:hypothetical protein
MGYESIIEILDRVLRDLFGLDESIVVILD